MPMANRFCKNQKGRAPRGTQSIDLRTRSLESGTASAFTARYPDTKSSMNQSPAFTTYRPRRELVEVASALLVRSAGAEGEAGSSGGCWGDICTGDRGSRIADRDASTGTRTFRLLTTNRRPTRACVVRLPRSHDCDG
jgi:hypothetical protein